MNLEAFLPQAEKLGVLGIMITRRGEEFSHFFEGDIRRNIYSASKTFTSAAVGIALREGLLSLEERLVDVFADRIPAHPDENLQRATVRDLLTMALGQEKACLMGPQRPLYQETDWVRMGLSIPFVYEPGTHFVYNNLGPYLAGILVQERCGCDLLSYLEPRLLTPLGIRKTVWEVDPQGRTFGAGGMMLCLSELHRLGLLYLQEGSWRGRQLLDPAWVRESSQKQVDNGQEGYGYLIWRGRENSCRIDGKYCQWSIVFPERDAVLSLFSECRRDRELMDLVFSEIYPQL